jgi:hypothetical protein
MANIKLKNLLRENMQRFRTKNLNEADLNQQQNLEQQSKIDFVVNGEYKATFSNGSYLKFKITNTDITYVDLSDPFGQEGYEGVLLSVYPETGTWEPTSFNNRKAGWRAAKKGDPIRIIKDKYRFQIYLPKTFRNYETFADDTEKLKKLK